MTVDIVGVLYWQWLNPKGVKLDPRNPPFALSNEFGKTTATWQLSHYSAEDVLEVLRHFGLIGPID